MTFILKHGFQASASVSPSFEQIDIIKTPVIAREEELVKKALFSFFWLNPVITQVLDVTTFRLGIIPFKDVPVR